MKKLFLLVGMQLFSYNCYADNLQGTLFNQDAVTTDKSDSKLSGIGPEELEKLCLRENSSKACLTAGKYFSFVNSEYKNYSKAQTVWEKGCSLSDGKSCVELGQFYEKNVLEGKNISDAVNAYKRGCSFNHAYSCYRLGNALRKETETVNKDSYMAYKKSLELASEGCDSNNGEDCFVKGNIYSYGKLQRPDYQKANFYYEEACKLNEGKGCANLGASYEYGEGVNQDGKQAKVYYEKGCALEDNIGCGNLGLLYLNEKDVKQD